VSEGGKRGGVLGYSQFPVINTHGEADGGKERGETEVRLSVPRPFPSKHACMYVCMYVYIYMTDTPGEVCQ
jgi:hypothetical protein